MMIGSHQGPSKAVAVVPLSLSVDIQSTLSACLSTATWQCESQQKCDSTNVVHAAFLSGKTRLSFLPCGHDVLKTLHTVKCADIVIFVVNSRPNNGEAIDEVCFYKL